MARVKFVVAGKGWRKQVTVETTAAAARRIMRGVKRLRRKRS